MKARAASSTVAFDVLYEDGTRSSNRKVPATILGGLDGDEPARDAIEEQDRVIGAASGRERPRIKSVSRTPVKPPPEPEKPAKKKR
ncbi:MAG: hypothetical protein INR65_10235 [Gluconacetobacter diazotrophicus]|nr:hypothetical protein [Gluconacetobacter diazotrophicus]